MCIRDSVERERADVGEAIQHARVLAELEHTQVIILLVEEIARLLTAEHIHSQLDAVLVDDVFRCV